MEGKLTPGVGVQICAPGAHFAKRKMGGDGDSKYHAGWGSGLTDWRCWGRLPGVVTERKKQKKDAESNYRE